MKGDKKQFAASMAHVTQSLSLYEKDLNIVYI